MSAFFIVITAQDCEYLQNLIITFENSI